MWHTTLSHAHFRRRRRSRQRLKDSLRVKRFVVLSTAETLFARLPCHLNHNTSDTFDIRRHREQAGRL